LTSLDLNKKDPPFGVRRRLSFESLTSAKFGYVKPCKYDFNDFWNIEGGKNDKQNAASIVKVLDLTKTYVKVKYKGIEKVFRL